MNRRGLGIGQLFAYIVLVITFAIITLFGYKAIAGFLHTGEQVQFVQFKSELEAAFQRLTTEYGSVRIEEFHLPPQYRQICFVDVGMNVGMDEDGFKDFDSTGTVSHVGNLGVEKDFLQKNDTVAASVFETASSLPDGYAGVDENVFLTPPAPVQIKVAKVKIAEREFAHEDTMVKKRAFLCLPIDRGSFKVHLEGKGSHVEIREVS